VSKKSVSRRKGIILNSKQVERSSSSNNLIKIPILKTPNLSGSTEMAFISRVKDEWNPFVKPEKCMICWKPIGLEDPFMECPTCGQRGHQVHILNWLAKKNFCPNCREKW
jgi:hypothetical protein